MADNGPGVAHRFAEIGQHFYVVPQLAQARDTGGGAKRPSSFSESEDWPQVRPSSQRGREMLSCNGTPAGYSG